jgi:5,10-methylene-tetrahydrofolate dehydrogenase/methenyl tetrahydrofolate cyclohydrolase
VCFLYPFSWLKPGAVVIDVGINSVEDTTTKKGTRLYPSLFLLIFLYNCMY